METDKKSHFGKYVKFYFIYTAVFAAVAMLIFGVFIKEGKSFVWGSDGLNQHYLSLVYYGDYLRQIVHNLFAKHQFVIPMWEMSIGYGADILLTLHYYVLGDPLNLLAAFVSAENMEYLYGALIILRIYLSGIAFSAYGFSHKKSRSGILVGALIYSFCGYVLYAGVRHPYFVNPMIYLPILLIGIDRIFQKKKPYLFIGAVALSAISNFYFFYMLCIFMFLYAVFRYWVTEKKFQIKTVFIWLLKFIGYFLIGIFLAAPVFLPVVFSMLGSQRLGTKSYVPLLYDLTYYVKAVMGFTGYVSPSNWNVMAYTPTALFSIMALFVKKKKHSQLKAGFLLVSLFVCIPFAGHVFNGFSYVTVRWIWGYSMLAAYMTACALPYFITLTKKEKAVVFSGSALFMLFSLFVSLKKQVYQSTMIGMCILMIVLIVLCMVIRKKEALLKAGILAVTIAALAINGFGCYQGSDTGYVKEFVDRGQGLSRLTKIPSNAIVAGEEEPVRYDQYHTKELNNSALISGKYSTQFYYSTSNSSISAFMREMNLNFSSDYHFDSLDGRSILEALASVRYFVVKNGEEGYLPYGYGENKSGETTINDVSYSAYENQDVSSLGKVYNSYIKKTDYDKMNVLEKQEALLYGVILEESDCKEGSAEFYHKEIPYEITLSEGIEEKEDNTFLVKKKGETITLTFQGMDECETYLLLKGLYYEGKKDIFDITVSTEALSKTISYRTEKFRGYCGIHDFLCNLGYQPQKQTSITIAFSQKGTYRFDELAVACQPVEQIAGKIETLYQTTMKHTTIGMNQVSGQVSLEEPGILLLSIPYSKGFTAYVDGEKQEIKQADTMYMALELEEGEHEILLKYTTPYLKPGIVLMVFGILCVIGMVFFYKRRANRK